MVPLGVLYTTFRIRVTDKKNKTKLASFFTFTIDNRQYLITAAHVMKDVALPGTIEMMVPVTTTGNQWVALDVDLVGIGTGKIGDDIAVLKSNEPVGRVDPLLKVIDEPDPNNEDQGRMVMSFMPGQQLYFLGYPLENGVCSYTIIDCNDGTSFPAALPLVKGAKNSGIDQRPKYPVMLLDGNNNAGFSGGPVVVSLKELITRVPETLGNLIDPANVSDTDFMVVGVIGGYFHENIRTESEQGGESLTISNSGIIFCTSFIRALTFIRKNPTGFLIEKK